MAVRLVVGLGNPGRKYQGTRHNLGFEWIEILSRSWNARFKSWKGLGEIALCRSQRTVGAPEAQPALCSNSVLLARPHTYMNMSGRMVQALASFYRINPEEILVGYDDLSLELGKIRIRLRGSAGGHLGMESILKAAGTQNVPRIRMGIGPLPAGEDASNFVLSRFPKCQKGPVDEMVEKACAATQMMAEEGIEKGMNAYNPVGPPT